MPDEIIGGKIDVNINTTGGAGGVVQTGGGGGGGAGAEVTGGLAGAAVMRGMRPMLAKLGAIAASTAILAKASPQLSATFGIMFKSLMLVLRPIGDVISMLLRPLAIGLIRFLIPMLKKWNQFKKTTLGEETGATLGGAAVGGAIGAAAGGPVGAVIGANVGALVGLLIASFPKIKEAFVETLTSIGEFFSNVGEGIKIVWEAVGTFVSENVITPIMDAWSTVVSFVIDNVITPIIDAWLSIWTFISESVIIPIKVGFMGVWTYIYEHLIVPVKKAFLGVYTYINENVIKPVKTAWGKIVEWFQTTIIDPVKTKFKALFDKIQGWIDSLKFWKKKKNKSDDEDDEKQTGGYIGETGMYKLHQGETVVPAHMQGMTNNFTPNITINANISNQMDLQSLADELSSIMMDNLQRRNSYTFT
jgi:hypothetical protein